jgi:hypothetical protein
MTKLQKRYQRTSCPIILWHVQTPPAGEPPELFTVSELAMLIGEIDPSAAAKLATDHAADGSGRCRVCRSTWPCTLYTVGRDGVAHARTSRLP